ncbi:MAG TPA: hypothetical protein VF989_18920 [Polyangiaceae bacterium]
MTTPKASHFGRLNIERDRKAAKTLLKALRSDDSAQARAAAVRIAAAHPAFRHLDPDAVLRAKPALRDVQLALAREYGFEDWNAWKQHVAIARGDRSALVAAANQAIAACDAGRLERLLGDVREPRTIDVQALATELFQKTLSWPNYVGENEAYETRSPCDRVLLDAGAQPGDGYLRAITTGSTRQLQLLKSRGFAPDNLRVAAAAGDLAAVARLFDEKGGLRPEGRPTAELSARTVGPAWPDAGDTARVLADALRFAARHNHREIVHFILLQAQRIEPELASKVASFQGAEPLAAFLCEHRESLNVDECHGSWDLLHELRLRLAREQNDAAGFQALLQEEPAFLDARHLAFQVATIEEAAFTHRTAIAGVLLAAEPAVLAEPERLTAAMRYAVEYANREMVELLAPLCRPRDDLPTWAALGDLERVRGFFDAAGELEPHSAELPGSLDGLGESYATLLHALGLACMNEQLDVAEYLLERGADIDGPWGTHQAATVLHEMAGHGKMTAIAFLVEHGAALDRRDAGYGAFAHGWAHVFGRAEAHAYLLERTAQVNLFAAVDLGAAPAVLRLIEQGRDVDECVEFGVSKGDTPLFAAVAQDKPDIVNLLLSHGANAKFRDHDNRGALHRIEPGAEHALEMARALVAVGADPRACDNDGLSAVAHARATNQHALAEFLESAAPVSSGSR